MTKASIELLQVVESGIVSLERASVGRGRDLDKEVFKSSKPATSFAETTGLLLSHIRQIKQIDLCAFFVASSFPDF